MELKHLTPFALLFATVVLYIAYVALYWKRKNVPQMFTFKRAVSVELLADSYDYFKTKARRFYGLVVGVVPCLVVTDAELIKNVLQKDFQHFANHGVHIDEKIEPLSGHLFNLDGEKWRKMRVKLTPTFTSGKIKTMFPILRACGQQMRDYIEEAVNNGRSLDIKNTMAGFTTDVIVSCAFGLESNSLADNDPFRKYGIKAVATDALQGLKNLINFTSKSLAKRFHLRSLDIDVEKFFMDTMRQTIDYRKKNDYKRDDFLQLLLDINDSANGTFTFEELAAQAFVFFVAGFETSASVMSFCLYELAQNPHVQEKVHIEIEEVLHKHDGQLTYDALMDMKYLNQTIEETLRKYPVVPLFFRESTADYRIPETDVVIEKGTKVFIPVYQMQNDERYFPNPNKFDPDRFSPENKRNIVPFTYLPFGEGPRICIGMRFGLTQVRTGLATILKDFRMYLDPKDGNGKTFDGKSLILQYNESIMLRAEKL